MQAIKALVIGLGIMILAGVGLLVYGITQKATDPEFKLWRSTPPTAATAEPNPTAFGETRVPLSEGCNVTEMQPDGARLYLRIGPAGACERIIAVDTATGRVVGSIWLRP